MTAFQPQPQRWGGLFRRISPNLTDRALLRHPQRDLSGALSCLIASVPQTMAYGAIATAALGPQWTGFGIIAALLSSVIHGTLAVLFGSNPSTVSGPRAATALVFATMLVQLTALPVLSGADPLLLLALAQLAVAGSGLIQVMLALLRVGRLASFIPYPVVAGFFNGSALLILFSQIMPLTGLSAAALSAGPQALWQAMDPGPLLLGLTAAVIMIVAGRRLPQVPPSLAGLLAGTGIYYLLTALFPGLGLGGTVGPLPDGGLPQISDLPAVLALLPGWTGGVLGVLIPGALSMAALNSLDALLASAALDTLTGRRSSGDRELLAQGVGNTLAGLLWMLPSSGSVARAGALVSGGSRSALGPLLVAGATLILVTAAGGLVSGLPRAVMAGLLVVVAIGLFDRWTLGLLRQGPARWPRGDLAAVLVVVVATLTFSLVVAVATGILMTLLLFVVRMAHSPVRRCYRATVLTARISGNPDRADLIDRYGDRIAVIELEGALFFGSVAALETCIDRLIADGVLYVVIDLRRAKDADATGARAVERWQARLRRHGGGLLLAYVERERRVTSAPAPGEDRRREEADRRLWRIFDRLGTVAALGEDSFQPDVDRALACCEAALRTRAGLAPGGTRRGVPAVLRGLDRRQLRILRAVMTRHVLPTGHTVFRQGDLPDSVYFVAAGQVDVVIDLAGTDRKLRVQTLTRGSIFGEMAVLDPNPRSASVEVSVPAVVYRLGAEDFRALKHTAPDLAFRLLENIALIFAGRLRATNLLLAELER